MSRGSSINFKKNSASLNHNDRTEQHEPKYLLPLEYRLGNECDVSAVNARVHLDTMINEAKANYTQKTGQRFQAKILTVEAVINLEPHHTLKDINKINQFLEERFGFRNVQSAIHRDEGVMIDYKPKYNIHAHITSCNLTKDGTTILKTLSKKDLSEIQDFVSNTLGMKRGQSAEITKAKHKTPQVFRAEKTKEDLVLSVSKNKNLKQDNINLKNELEKLKELQKQERAELQKQGAVRSDYAALEQKYRDLKEQLELQIQNLKTAGNSYYADLVAIYETLPANAKKEVDAKEKSIDQAKEVSKQAISAIQATIPLKAENDTLKQEKSVLRADMRVLSDSLIESQSQVQQLEKHIEARIPVEYEPKRSLRDRFVGFMKELKEQIKAQASEILNLKDQVQLLQAQNQEYKALVSDQLAEIATKEIHEAKYEIQDQG